MEKELAEILKLVRSMNDRIVHLETELKNLKESVFFSEEQRKRIQKEIGKISEVRTRKVKSLSPGERRIYDLFRNTWNKEGEVVLSQIQQMTDLDYKTIAGYANLLVRYGVLERHWDSARKINTYTIPKME